MNKKEETIATYNATAERMAEKFRNIGARVEDIERGFALVGKENPNVLEIGCGDGRDAKEILKRTNNYLGIDVSDSMVRVARGYAPEGKFEVADVETFSFPQNIDLIFAFASLLHSNRENVKSVLERAHASLNSGGIFYISLKHDEYHEASKTDEFGTRTYYFYTPEEIKSLAGEGYSTAYEHFQELRGQKWLEIALKKTG